MPHRWQIYVKVCFQLDRYACLTVPAQVPAPQSVNSCQVTGLYSRAASTRRVRLSLYATSNSRSSLSLRRLYLTLSRSKVPLFVEPTSYLRSPLSDTAARDTAGYRTPHPTSLTIVYDTPPYAILRPTPHCTTSPRVTPHTVTDTTHRVRHRWWSRPTCRRRCADVRVRGDRRISVDGLAARPTSMAMRSEIEFTCAAARSWRGLSPQLPLRALRCGLSPRLPCQATRRITNVPTLAVVEHSRRVIADRMPRGPPLLALQSRHCLLICELIN